MTSKADTDWWYRYRHYTENQIMFPFCSVFSVYYVIFSQTDMNTVLPEEIPYNQHILCWLNLRSPALAGSCHLNTFSLLLIGWLKERKTLPAASIQIVYHHHSILWKHRIWNLLLFDLVSTGDLLSIFWASTLSLFGFEHLVKFLISCSFKNNAHLYSLVVFKIKMKIQLKENAVCLLQWNVV